LFRVLCLFIGLVLATIVTASNARADQEIDDHDFIFFLHPALTEGMPIATVGQRLSQYVDDLNTIFSKQTLHRFNFDPGQHIVFSESSPHTGYAFPPLPDHGFEIWAWVQLSDWVSSYGGYASFDVSGAGVAAGLYWDKIYDRATLLDGSEELRQYWIQIDHLVHEIEHILGAGIGEYYNLAQVNDTTGTPPLLNISLSAESDSFWDNHQDYWGDPLLRLIWNWDAVGSPTAWEDLINETNFAPVTAAAINHPCRMGNSCYDETIPDLTRTQIRIYDNADGEPLLNATVKIWKVKSVGQYDSEIIAEGVTDNNGEFEFSWDAAFNNFDYLALIKASIATYYPNAVWISIFDAQEQKLVLGREQMVVELPLILHTGDMDRDNDTDGLDLYDLIVDMSQLELSIFAENFGNIHESNSI